jgi:predicted AAA+ superfamily ATPase
MAVDKDRRKGMFWLTGSQPFNLMQGVSESLAGRVAILELHGLSQSEKNGRNDYPFLPDTVNTEHRPAMDLYSLYETILRGSFPELYANSGINRALFYSSYLKKNVSRNGLCPVMTQPTKKDMQTRQDKSRSKHC